MGLFSSLVGGASKLWSWGSSSATKFLGAELGAVAISAVKVAATGAVIGAATAAIKGEDIGKGALTGGLYGAAIGGIAESFNQFALGGDWGAQSAIEDSGKEVIEENLGGGSFIEATSRADGMPMNWGSSNNSGLLTNVTANKGGFFDGLPAAGLRGGLDMYSSMEAEEAQAEAMAKNTKATIAGQKEVMDHAAQIKQDAIATNQPGTLNIATIKKGGKDAALAWYNNNLNNQSATIN